MSPLDVFAAPLEGSALIEASAGTGKTWNICGLYLRLVLERRLEVAQILVVTFTNAATAELRERIRQRLVDVRDALRRGGSTPPADPFVAGLLGALRRRGAEDDAALEARLERALQTFDEASIFTIHGFCQRALADAPFAAQMPLALELVADDAELRHEVAADLWRRHVAAPGLAPLLAAELARCKDTPDTWAELLKRRLAKPLARIEWPAAIDAPAGDDGATVAALHAAYDDARAAWAAQRAEVLAAVQAAMPGLKANVYKDSSVAQAATAWDAWLGGGLGDALAEAPKAAELFTPAKLAASVKKGGTPPAHPFFDAAQAWVDARAAALDGMALARLRLLRTVLDEGLDAVRRSKRERRVIAFDDMLLNLHERLADPATGDALAATLRERFPAALIDEFQDTDPLQFAIFRRLYRGDPAPSRGRPAAPGSTHRLRGADGGEDGGPGVLFLVGDPKQAIYGFRNADLPTYLAARDEADAAYTLAENQRSSATLIGALNALFTRQPRAFVQPGLDYVPVQVGAKPRAPYVDTSGEPRAALQLWTLPADEEGAPLAKPAALQAAARGCAAEIARLLHAARAGEVTLGGRPLAAGDIAVLVRSHAQGAQTRLALAQLGIGSVELSQASVFASADAEAMEWLLAAVIEPTRERRLRAALATEWMGLDAAAIDALADDEHALLGWVQRFTEDRETWLARGAGVMLRRWMQRERVAERLLARADGERRLTNLLHLTELLHAASEEHAAPPALLQWLQRQRAAGTHDDAAQLRLESDRNLVQIVTIHKSKGLEYPIVFCPYLWDAAGARDGGAGGLPQDYLAPDGTRVLDFRTLPDGEQAEVTRQRREAAAAEFLRLVYVALTRAVHRCDITIGSYAVRESTTESRRAWLNWLVAGDGLAPTEWPQHGLTPEAIAAAWSGFAASAVAALPAADGAPAAVALAPLPTAPGTPLPPSDDEAVPLAARTLAAPPPLGGWIGSYSSLVHGARTAAAADHDTRVQPAEATPARAAARLADDDILRFPRGPAAGDALHAVFERAAFGDDATWDGAIAEALALHPQPAGPRPLAPMLRRMLADVLQTPLPAAELMLAELPPTRRLVELEFMLPARRVDPGALNALLRRHGYPVAPLAPGGLAGWLRGFIDLVFEHDGRWWIVDWKSNHLGDTPADYGADALAAAMAAHGYPLQYLLYALALRRWLRQRLPGYDHARHFGGVMYLFVRGVRPGWRQRDGTPCGVFVDRPGDAVLDALSALLGEPEAAGDGGLGSDEQAPAAPPRLAATGKAARAVPPAVPPATPGAAP